MEKQLSFEVIKKSSGKPSNRSPFKKHLSSEKDKRVKLKDQLQQLVPELLPEISKEPTLKSLSLEKQALKASYLKEIATSEQNPKKEKLFENLIGVKTVAEMLGLAPKTIHNWVYLRKIPYVKCGQKVMFRPKSLEAWLNRKEIKPWL